MMSSYRSLLAKQRTQLALMRTGLALITLGIVFTRYFGLGYWTAFDALLILAGGACSIYSIRSYLTTRRIEAAYAQALAPLFPGMITPAPQEANAMISDGA